MIDATQVVGLEFAAVQEADWWVMVRVWKVSVSPSIATPCGWR